MIPVFQIVKTHSENLDNRFRRYNHYILLSLQNESIVTLIVLCTVLGCADLIAPNNAWYKRQGNVATLGCNKQNKTWHLRCDGGRWQGVVGSCDQTGT